VVDACKLLNKAECDESMKGIVFAGFKKTKGKRAAMGTMYELDEAPGAYKNIEEVIADETDLIEPIMRLLPLGVLKG
jgi:tRNA-splicing ligase RtcB